MFKWASSLFRKKQRKVAQFGTQKRMYSNALGSRLTSSWSTNNSSADAELVSGLTTLRSRSRALVRDASYAKRAKVVVVNNVIGAGIGMQGQVKTTRDTLNTAANDSIEAAWDRWSYADSCHTGGRLCFADMERAAMGQVVEAGEVFFRKHYTAFGYSKVPYALELIEAERIADELETPYVGMQSGNQVRMGIEMDSFYRPVAYYIRAKHLSEIRWTGEQGNVERVPADQIIHLAPVDRWPQTRGEPWMHTALRRMNDMDGYSEAEITRARTQACSVGAIETPEDSTSFGETQEDGSVEMELQAGTYQRLNPGEKLNALSPTSPNPALDPFMRYMLREIAAGVGVSYESLSRDYSQSNYSSSRLALLEDRDLWRVFQGWFLRSFRQIVHREWLQQAVLSRAVNIRIDEYMSDTEKYEAVLFKPRGWSWVDPTSEVEAYKEAIKAGLTTRADVIANTADGRDIEDIDEARAQELENAKKLGLKFDTDPDVYTADSEKAKADAKAALRPPDPEPEKTTPDSPPVRAVSFLR